MRALVLMLSAILVGCSGDTSDKTGTPPGDDDDDDTDVEVETGLTTPEAGIDVAAVGFELIGVIEADGSFGPFVLDGTEYPPQVIITFTDVEYFSLADDAKDGHFCTANGFFGTSDGTVFDVTPVPPSATPLVTRSMGVMLGEAGTDFDNALLFTEYDVALLIDTTTHDCAGVVDAELWGEDGELLVEPFNGAHFGFGFGQLTDYMREGWSQETLDEFETSMVADYIAINDQNGDFLAYDWGTSLLWQVDPDTNEVLFEADGKTYLGPVAVDFVPAGGDLPEAYAASYVFWYQDFAASSGSEGLDLTNLRDGAP